MGAQKDFILFPYSTEVGDFSPKFCIFGRKFSDKKTILRQTKIQKKEGKGAFGHWAMPLPPLHHDAWSPCFVAGVHCFCDVM